MSACVARCCGLILALWAVLSPNRDLQDGAHTLSYIVGVVAIGVGGIVLSIGGAVRANIEPVGVALAIISGVCGA